MSTFTLIGSALLKRRRSNKQRKYEEALSVTTPSQHQQEDPGVKGTVTINWAPETEKSREISACEYLSNVEKNNILRKHIEHQSHIRFLTLKLELCENLLETYDSEIERETAIQQAYSTYQAALKNQQREAWKYTRELVYTNHIQDFRGTIIQNSPGERFTMLSRATSLVDGIYTEYTDISDRLQADRETLLQAHTSTQEVLIAHETLSESLLAQYREEEKALRELLKPSAFELINDIDFNLHLRHLMAVRVEYYALIERKFLLSGAQETNGSYEQKASEESSERLFLDQVRTMKLKFQAQLPNTAKRESVYAKFSEYIDELAEMHKPRLAEEHENISNIMICIEQRQKQLSILRQKFEAEKTLYEIEVQEKFGIQTSLERRLSSECALGNTKKVEQLLASTPKAKRAKLLKGNEVASLLDEARKYEHEELVTLLKSKGAKDIKRRHSTGNIKNEKDKPGAFPKPFGARGSLSSFFQGLSSPKGIFRRSSSCRFL
jgi:hypothetical protein